MNDRWFEVGLLLRGQFRRELIKAGINFTEHKSMLESIFIIGSDEEYATVWQWASENGILSGYGR